MMIATGLWDVFIDESTGWLQKIFSGINRELPYFSPGANFIVILAYVLRVELGEWMWSLSIPPDLTEDSGVHDAHQLLAENVKAVRDMEFDDRCVVEEFYLA